MLAIHSATFFPAHHLYIIRSSHPSSHPSSRISHLSDYYSVLGLTSTASLDEIKNAYIQLAPKYHPDTSSQFSEENKETLSLKFKEISEAYSILAQQELKNKYDFLRRQYAYKNAFSIDLEMTLGPSGYGSSTTEISTGYNTQKLNYTQNVRPNASSTVQQDKYKMESWRNLSLKEKKVMLRVQNHSCMSMSITFTTNRSFIIIRCDGICRYEVLAGLWLHCLAW